VVNPRFLGGPNERMIAGAIENLLLVQRQAPQAAALTLLLMLERLIETVGARA
jgi:ABC-type spermidine/putrescine transport system permease subunit I